jgi:tryptophan synthase alpha chain
MDTLWMGYLNPFYHYGMEEFFKKAKEFGITGEIIPDLPFEETFIYQELAKKYEQSIITFVSPTHSKERIAQVVKNATKFIYMVAYAGITGSGKSEDLTQVIKTVKENTKTPLYVGFGVDENTCKEKSVGVDGVIVGSAFVKHIIDDSLSYNEKIDRICKISKEIKEKING